MSERRDSGSAQANPNDKSQELLPSGRERITQGQQFDEMQRQQKNPDGAPRGEDETQG
jgi:hypothetical protein